MDEFFIIPVLDQYLIYAPLFRYAQIVDFQQVDTINLILSTQKLNMDRDLKGFLPELKEFKKEKIQKPRGPLTSPLFLGLVTTRGCNMGCRYCDFLAPKLSSPVMSVDIAQKSLDMYLSILSTTGINNGQVEFFGGEPFYKNRIAEFAVSYGRYKSKELGIDLQFKVTTNGVMSQARCEWVSDNFDTVVLSLDGPDEFQNKNRPLINRANSSGIVCRSAKILSTGNAELIIRSCITEFSVNQMVEIAEWLTQEFVVESICFEPLTPSDFSLSHSLTPPDPYSFAHNFLEAQDALAFSGINLVTSGTDIDALQNSFCPLGKDALIVTPEGNINSCYLIENEWEKLGFDLTIGRICKDSPNFTIYPNKLNSERSFNKINSPLCKKCFAKFHCSGGCHVNHFQIRSAIDYDRLCIQTRLIIIGNLLKRINELDLYKKWLNQINEKIN